MASATSTYFVALDSTVYDTTIDPANGTATDIVVAIVVAITIVCALTILLLTQIC